ncbi:MAG: hypothetical protein ACFFFH_12390 [Candidatus Thorarchaeota archaeon]
MSINQAKFPFKYFIRIINALEDENILSAWQIAKSIGSCISDASEVTRMLHYLTHYGKIVSNPKKGCWKIIRNKQISEPPLKNFRVRYVEKCMALIEGLTSEPQSVEELGEKLSLELNEIRDLLPYLRLITEKGYIHLEGSDHRQQWSLKPWP